MYFITKVKVSLYHDNNFHFKYQSIPYLFSLDYHFMILEFATFQPITCLCHSEQPQLKNHHYNIHQHKYFTKTWCNLKRTHFHPHNSVKSKHIMWLWMTHATEAQIQLWITHPPFLQWRTHFHLRHQGFPNCTPHTITTVFIKGLKMWNLQETTFLFVNFPCHWQNLFILANTQLQNNLLE